MADALATPVGEVEALLLACHQDRLAAVRLGFGIAAAEDDRAAFPLLGLAQLGLKALHVQPLAVSVLLEVLLDRVEHRGGAAEEGLALRPVGADLLEVGRLKAPVVLGVLLVAAQPLMAALQLAQLFAED